jgi:purine-binding chemotaxis protein CheW
MNDDQSLTSHRVAELRSAFDLSFARTPNIDATPKDDLLIIRLEATAYALRLAHVAGLFAGKKITRVPSGVPGLLGIAGFRGAIMPVYDLAALMDHTPAEAPRWLVIAANAPVAFAFAGFEGHVRVSREALAIQQTADQPRRYVRELVRTQETIRPLIDLASMLEAVTKQAT